MKNPYPKTINDEDSGVEVKNDDHVIWQQGYDSCFKDCLKAIESLMDEDYNPK